MYSTRSERRYSFFFGFFLALALMLVLILVLVIAIALNGVSPDAFGNLYITDSSLIEGFQKIRAIAISLRDLFDAIGK